MHMYIHVHGTSRHPWDKESMLTSEVPVLIYVYIRVCVHVQIMCDICLATLHHVFCDVGGATCNSSLSCTSMLRPDHTPVSLLLWSMHREVRWGRTQKARKSGSHFRSESLRVCSGVKGHLDGGQSIWKDSHRYPGTHGQNSSVVAEATSILWGSVSHWENWKR